LDIKEIAFKNIMKSQFLVLTLAFLSVYNCSTNANALQENECKIMISAGFDKMIKVWNISDLSTFVDSNPIA